MAIFTTDCLLASLCLAPTELLYDGFFYCSTNFYKQFILFRLWIPEKNISITPIYALLADKYEKSYVCLLKKIKEFVRNETEVDAYSHAIRSDFEKGIINSFKKQYFKLSYLVAIFT